MSKEIYSQILALKNYQDNIKRGRDFEALIREVMPWDQRPPIVSSQDSEQLDGVFIYKGVTFIIESKAIKKPITPGMAEWEDFELKIQRRHKKRVVGLFCCLFEVSKDLIRRAREMNLTGVQTIVIAGKDWEDIAKADIYFPSILDYLMLSSDLKNTPSLDSIKNAQAYIYDKQSLGAKMLSTAKKTSSAFLRRFKHKFHDQLYLERSINNQIKSFLQGISPQSLKGAKNKDGAKQIIVVRDFSGSGKITLSIDLASHSTHAFCFAVTANMSTIDEVIDDFIDLNKYPNLGLKELLAVDKPLMLIVDSLDETPLQNHVQKRREIKSLIKRVEELNLQAQGNGLSHFPILLMFTIREEYWRDWEASFEGRQEVVQLKKLLSNYNNIEFQEALAKYSAAYNYSIVNQLASEAVNILSVPINLEIFSEANHFEGEIQVDDIWEGKILSNYFDKKEEAISKHHIEGFNTRAFNKLICQLAYNLLLQQTTLFSKADFNKLISTLSSQLDFNSEYILTNLISEQIIINDVEKGKNYRFKYIRFMEYLVALHIIEKVSQSGDLTTIDQSIKVIYDSNIVSIYSVLNNIKHICKTRFQEIEQDIIDYYSHSEAYLNNYLPELRGHIARGECLDEDVVKSIITNNFTQSASSSWNTFFILSAKNINQKPSTIIPAFQLAWETNKGNSERWKLISKLSDRFLLIQDKVVHILLGNSVAREWEEYLGKILSLNLNESFLQLWSEIAGDRVFTNMVDKDPEEWHLANRLLSLVYRNEGYILGDMLSDEKPRKKEYVVFEKSLARKLPLLDAGLVAQCESFVEGIEQRFAGTSTKTYLGYSVYHNFSKDALQYINIKLEPLLGGRFAGQERPFLNHLFHEFTTFKSLIRLFQEQPGLEIPLDGVDKGGRTLFMEIIDLQDEDVLWMLEFIFGLGYQHTSIDERYLEGLIKNNQGLNATAFENICMANCFLCLKNTKDFGKIREKNRELCVLFSAKFKRNIGFKFSNFLQVANNALEHYSEHGDLFIRAFAIYGWVSELELKPSYQKKVDSLGKSHVRQNHDYDVLFRSVFKELF